jgi:hypothetical protein
VDVVLVVVIVVCALLLGVIVGWVSRAPDRCSTCGLRLTCTRCQPGTAGLPHARLRITTTARLHRP